MIVGFDGQDPVLTDRLMAAGKLPHLKTLADRGCYHRLRTVYPSLSPAAWSSFCTGVHPAKHRIFDFLDRDPHTYLPLLGSTRISPVTRFLKLGRFRIPLQKPEIRLTRGSKAFWSFLGEHNTWSTVLRVPITFPPEKFYGAELSAMCAPDLLGTQGTFLLFTTRRSGERFKEGGARFPLTKNGDGYTGRIEGPENSFLAGNPPMTLPLAIRPDPEGKRALVKIRDAEVELEPGRLSDWVTLAFRAAPGIKVKAICRMMLTELDEHVSLYVTPLNLDPENPAMPDLAPVLLRDLPREEDRAVRDARAGRGHLGAQRGGDRRRDLPADGVRHRPRAPGDVLRDAGAAAGRDASRASSTPPTASSTCSGATPRRATRPREGTSRARTRTRSRSSTSTTTTWSARSWRSCATATC